VKSLVAVPAQSVSAIAHNQLDWDPVARHGLSPNQQPDMMAEVQHFAAGSARRRKVSRSTHSLKFSSQVRRLSLSRQIRSCVRSQSITPTVIFMALGLTVRIRRFILLIRQGFCSLGRSDSQYGLPAGLRRHSRALSEDGVHPRLERTATSPFVQRPITVIIIRSIIGTSRENTLASMRGRVARPAFSAGALGFHPPGSRKWHVRR